METDTKGLFPFLRRVLMICLVDGFPFFCSFSLFGARCGFSSVHLGVEACAEACAEGREAEREAGPARIGGVAHSMKKHSDESLGSTGCERVVQKKSTNQLRG